KLRKPTSY
ncbi:carbon starvation CstA family protein, partial [Vibrio parahaemolyticus VPTS-2010_2]